MTEIAFLPAAEADYTEALEWYQERSSRAAIGFEVAVEVALQSIAQAPERWPRCGTRHRIYILRRFPYSIVYRLDFDGVLVVAVAHARRSPTFWHDRD